MQVQEKNNKGFNILELIVVIAIIGILSATAIPKFNDWRHEREVRVATVEIKSIIQNIYLQIERGVFAYVQVKFEPINLEGQSKGLRVITKGMTMPTLIEKMNEEPEVWSSGGLNNSARCEITSSNEEEENHFWDSHNISEIEPLIEPPPDAPEDDVQPEVVNEFIKEFVTDKTFSNVKTNLTDINAICFARNGKFYDANGTQLNSTDGPQSYLFLCSKNNDGMCNITYNNSDPSDKPDPNSEEISWLKSVNWSMFGDISVSKYAKEWID